MQSLRGLVVRALRWARRPRMNNDYASRMALEARRFDADLCVHDLPAIFHYWSHNYLGPLIRQFGLEGFDDFFAKQVLQAYPDPAKPLRIVGVGSGDCAVEFELLRRLHAAGRDDVQLTCTDISEQALARARESLRGSPLEGQVRLLVHDINQGLPSGKFEIVLANQSLHHVLGLEPLFASIRAQLAPGGRFLVSDVIGRNGHQRWPEARALLEPFWAELPDTHKYNHLLQRTEHEYLDWDCSNEGFEGIRAQDVLPQLLTVFQPNFFLAWGNIIDVIIDRGFGHNFRNKEEWELRFIDRVQAADAEAIAQRRISPTHLLASFQVEPCECVHLPGMRPQDALRAEPVSAGA